MLVIFSSDPYVRIDLNTLNGNETLDSILTKTKKKVFIIFCYKTHINVYKITNTTSKINF